MLAHRNPRIISQPAPGRWSMYEGKGSRRISVRSRRNAHIHYKVYTAMGDPLSNGSPLKKKKKNPPGMIHHHTRDLIIVSYLGLHITLSVPPLRISTGVWCSTSRPLGRKRGVYICWRDV